MRGKKIDTWLEKDEEGSKVLNQRFRYGGTASRNTWSNEEEEEEEKKRKMRTRI